MAVSLLDPGVLKLQEPQVFLVSFFNLYHFLLENLRNIPSIAGE